MIDRIVACLKLRQDRNGAWSGVCPVCLYAKPSLAIKTVDGKIWAACAAGCSPAAVLRAIRRLGVDLADDQIHGEDPERTRKKANARSIWRNAKPAPGTLVENYLRNRGIVLPVSEALRFVPHQRNWREDRTYPAMIACVRDGSGEQTAVHITSLTPDGAKAPVEHPKLMLGPVGGNAVHMMPLDQIGDTLALAEGIETALSVQQLTNLPTWACLSAVGLQKVVLLERIRHALIACDGDPVGRRHATKAAVRLEREGRRVCLRVAPTGQDFNDILLKMEAANG